MTVIGLVEPVPVKLPGLDVTVYPVIAAPPFDVGAVKGTVADAFPPVAVPIVGAPGTRGAYVYSVFAPFVPPAVVTRTLAVPTVPAGMVAVIVVEFTGTTLRAALPPIVTPVAPVRFVPVIVTLVPPAIGPLLGLRLVTVGAGLKVYSIFAAFVPPAVVTRTLTVKGPAAILVTLFQSAV